jgi:catechol 2,3-dioxygenase-like lactoylglutathione lyase family enzyme
MASTPYLGFVIFYVSDLEESLKFFTETLGLKHNPKADTPNFRGFVNEEGKGLPFGLALVSEEISPEARKPGTVEVYFETSDLEDRRAELAREGARPTEIAHRYFGSFFSIPAPDGHLVTLLRSPAR